MKLDNRGNIIIGTTAILIAVMLLMCIFITFTLNSLENQNLEEAANDNFRYIIDDYSENLEVLCRMSIEKATQKIFDGGHISNSRREISDNLNDILTRKNDEYRDKYGVNLHTDVLSVEPTDSPWQVLFKVRLTGDKDGESFSKILLKNASIEGLRDPMPLAKLTVFSGVLTYDDTYHYKTALSAYMLLHHLPSPESYIEATAPLIIKKCPYDPYIHHGDPGVLKDCLKQGFFHESADGCCYLCRLEAKGKCEHYGMEVFIQTHTPLNNETLSCSDHVVFSDHYNGKKIDEDDWNSLILDNSHRKKYGLWSNESVI